MSSNNHDELLRQAAEAIRAGKKEDALKLVVQVLEDDEDNVKALTLAYRLVDDTGEKIEVLEKILEVDPGNAKAQEALDKLTGGRKSKKVSEDEEVAPGVSRRQVMLLGGGVLAFTLVLLLIAVVVITTSNQSRQSEFATQTAFIVNPTQTAIIMAATEVAGTVQAQQTGDAQATLTTHTPTPTNTPPGATLPPEFTNTATSTPDVSPTPLSPPSGVSGTILAHGGDNLLNDGNADIWALPLNSPGTANRLNETYRGLFPTANTLERFVFSAFRPDFFEHELVLLDNGEITFLSQGWTGATDTPKDATQPFMSADGTQVVFVGLDSNNFKQLYLYNSTPPVGLERLKRLTNDQNNYSFPSFSPDGLRVLATIETGVPPQVIRDLILLDLETLGITSLTTDGPATIETMPRFSPDGSIVAYAAEVGDAGNHDIYLRASDGFGEPIRVTNDGGATDNIYPVYSPDGNFLAFSSNRRGRYNIFIYALTTGLLNQLTDSQTHDYYPGAWLQ